MLVLLSYSLAWHWAYSRAGLWRRRASGGGPATASPPHLLPRHSLRRSLSIRTPVMVVYYVLSQFSGLQVDLI